MCDLGLATPMSFIIPAGMSPASTMACSNAFATPDLVPSSCVVPSKIALTTSGDILEAIAIGDGPDSYLIILGYSGWNPGQLEEELSENSWIEIPKDFDIIFNTPSKDQIDVLSKKIGFNLRMVSPDFGNA